MIFATLGESSRCESPGTTAVPILQVPLAARGAGMGNAFSAVANDSSALFYNPAGLARLSLNEVASSFISGAGDTSLQSISYVGPMAWTGISGNGRSSAATNLLYAQSGSIEVNRLNPDGSLGSSQRVSAGSDLVVSLAYAERVAITPVDIEGKTYSLDHFIGLTPKYVRSTILTYSANAFALDAGYLLYSADVAWSFGAAALNVGQPFRYAQEKEHLPTTLRGGVAWHGGVPSLHNVLIALDGDYVINERQWHANTGVEYFWLKTYGARIGYQIHRDDAGLTMGMGLRWKGRVFFDYAWGLASALSNTHRMTLTYRFGSVPQAQRERTRSSSIEPVSENEESPQLQDPRPESLKPSDSPRRGPRKSSQITPTWIY